ncbi:Beta-lactamase class A [Streptomyces sp. TLI_053]|uniref:serine hydrolase n=1 Tax=Streptomyces sp. TLI_053 TaxID=1855352 RepID=UPI00087D08EA|nr:serine hydrolase [Streptomyces sp. TLI_053]SDT80690.1 Beta-lactamase class A [Streptomyces sp. TLI_053]
MAIRSVPRARVLVPVGLLVAAGAVAAALQGPSGGVGSGPQMSVVADTTSTAPPAVTPAAPGNGPAVTPTAPAAPTTAQPTTAAAAAPTASPGDAVAALHSAVDRAEGAVSVAVTDLGTGQSLSYGGPGHGFATASIVKLDILATLLLRTQDAGAAPTAAQRDLATTMIENSDNDSATGLWEEIGADPGLDAANARFGLTATEAGQDGYWGLTTTTADDQLRLLRQVFTGDSLLSATSRDYIRELLDQVEEDQRWGVGAAASDGGFAVKNGWLPRDSDGLWVINSIGRVERDGHELLIAVVSDGNTTDTDGVDLVESVARAAAEAVTGS